MSTKQKQILRQGRRLQDLIHNPPSWLADYSEKNNAKKTSAEEFLWLRLQNRGWNTQVPCKRWIMDFYNVQHRLCIEVDGGIHATQEQVRRDHGKDAGLWQEGIRILRFVNKRVLEDIDAVLMEIQQAVIDQTKVHATGRQARRLMRDERLRKKKERRNAIG